MILIADSGSTKTEWKILDNGVPGNSYFSAGINPFFMNSAEIVEHLKSELAELDGKKLSCIYFYGSGCSGEARYRTISQALGIYFDADKIYPASDLLGAARSLCQDEPGIACIMGTGSNSCYYDGKKIEANVAPLGYILGDEGGAAVLGRKLVSAVLKKQISPEVTDMFYEEYKLTTGEILENVYMKPFPNRFLGQFAKFINAHSDIAEMREIVSSSFEDFIRRNILQYPQSKDLPVHFTGSIAWHFRHILVESLVNNRLTAGVISLSPMENLVKFHLRNPNLQTDG